MKRTDLYERKTHGSPAFPLQYYRVDATHPQYVMPLHWHNEFEVVQLLEGTLTLYIQDNAYTLYPGDAAFIDCGFLHSGDPHGAVYEVAVFDVNMLIGRRDNAIAALLLPIISGEKEVAPPLPRGENEPLSAAVRALFDTVRDETATDPLTVYAALFSLFAQLYRNGRVLAGQQTARGRHKGELVASLIDWIEQHYTEDISLERLAGLCGTNKKYLCTLFKAFTQTTPMDYVNRVRVENACYEMTAHHKTVTEAALASGFNDPNYFTRVFKKYKGIAPKKYLTTHPSQAGIEP